MAKEPMAKQLLRYFTEIIEGVNAGLMSVGKAELNPVEAHRNPTGHEDAAEIAAFFIAAEFPPEQVPFSHRLSAGREGAKAVHWVIRFGPVVPADRDFVADELNVFDAGHEKGEGMISTGQAARQPGMRPDPGGRGCFPSSLDIRF